MHVTAVSFRDSIRWIPGAASEPSHVIVLTGGKTGVFLDVRFLKDSNELEWAFAGYRLTALVEDKEVTKFTHLIDSRTKDPSKVADYGSNTALPNGTVLEKGEMVNPETGKMTAYEEVWRDNISFVADEAVFLRNASSTGWYARVGCWQLGLGRNCTGNFWAFQAHLIDQEWVVLYRSGMTDGVTLLPRDASDWAEGAEVNWNGDRWLILERD
ncbi:hypothetical protein DFH05DRAFT_1542957 [Lentinula detonsa]|uniref:Uncharacterized protein n=1 Tax=Lentinula detonsa TaxID=2804962 RepID=A0A9W8P1Q0_9AGAR|nr:hypothetical protein DFH05DRAFT_1542957 [Lentinula detonsa]